MRITLKIECGRCESEKVNYVIDDNMKLFFRCNDCDYVSDIDKTLYLIEDMSP